MAEEELSVARKIIFGNSEEKLLKEQNLETFYNEFYRQGDN